MALNSVSAGGVANAADLNQYKDALEGAIDFPAKLVAASGTDFFIQLANTGGGTYFKVQNSSSTVGLSVDSNGVVTPTNLQVPTAATPADTVAGRLAYDTTNNVLVYGNGTVVTRIADGASTRATALPAILTENNNATTFTTIWTEALEASGTYLVEMAIIYLSGTTPDIKFEWDVGNVPLCTIEWGQTGSSAINGAAPSGGGAITTYNSMHDQSQTMVLSGQGTGADNKVMVPMVATVHNDTTAGNLLFKFSQNVADVSNTQVLVGSSIKITRDV